ncbi:MAG: T9SS type A sorting domain-containing protein [Bacteroidia bacterium]
MKRIITLLTALLLLLAVPTIAKQGEPCNTKLIAIDKGDKLVLCISDIETNGLLVKVFNPKGMIIENTTLSGKATNYTINKPAKGVYWVSMKNGSEVKVERFIVR